MLVESLIKDTVELQRYRVCSATINLSGQTTTILPQGEDDLMNYFRMPIHNGTVEGLNNKAKVISHKVYGFRTARNYIRNLYHCTAELPLPKTVHTFA
jgi:hypothetical protein